VLPVYNVEEYLQAALDSLAVQTYRDIEVVMVDDGSTDSSAEIAAGFADVDGRFTLVRQENGGLGNARNTGARHATGDLLMFVDSDDVIPHYAFSTIVRTLEQTGSDFVTGKVSRIDARGAFPAPMHREAFTESVLRTSVVERPFLMRDLLACNKVYRREFWDDAGLEFVEGILYEDGPTSVRAHAWAKSVDVIAVPIYYWRLRDGVTKSLSQQSEDKSFFVDRIYASRVSVDYLRQASRQDLIPSFFAMDIRHKFEVMYRALPLATGEIQQLFMQSAVPHLHEAPEEVIDRLPRPLREKVLLTRSGKLEELLHAIRPAPAAGPHRHSVARRVTAALRRSESLRKAKAYVATDSSSARVRSAVTGMIFRGGELVIQGYGYIPGLPAEGPLTGGNRLFWARHEKLRRLVRLRARSRPSPVATASALDDAWSYRRSGFEATLDLRQLTSSDGGWLYGTWVLALGVPTPRGFHRGGLRVGPESNRLDLQPYQLDAHTRIVPFAEDGVLKLKVEQADVLLEHCRLEGSRMTLRGRTPVAVTGTGSVHLARVAGVGEVTVPATFQLAPEGDSVFSATLPVDLVADALVPASVPPVAGVQDRLFLEVSFPQDATARSVACGAGFGGSVAVSAGHHVTLHPESDGSAVVTVRPILPVAERATWDDRGILHVSGSGADGDAMPQVVCRHTGRKEERAFPVEVGASGSWSVQIDPGRAPNGCGFAALRSGLWRLVLRIRSSRGELPDTDLPYLPQVFEEAENLRIEFADRYRLERIGVDALALRVYSRLRPEERGSYHSRILRESFYPRARTRLPLFDVVLYDSYTGKQYSDSPRAVYEALAARDLGLGHIWVTNDGQAPVPPSVHAVERGSRAWFEALASSRYIVTNTHLPPWFRRRQGQVVVQTWHGIGFKRVGFDIEQVQFANKTYLANLEREAPNWSFVVSPNSFCTPILRRAFRYQGEICEIGSPRNDLLISGDRAAITAGVRAALGLPPDKKILLYAPTWRDNEYHGPGMYKFNLRLDVARFPPELREDYVLLVRRHSNTVDDLLGRGSDFVWDVANYPDTGELLAAADVLITDYSTIALDFANTGRPILFFTYDLDSYRDDLRGFYFDLESEGPGPVLRTTTGVVAVLRDLPAVMERYRERYKAFRQIFGHLEDGHATQRCIERMLRGRPHGARVPGQRLPDGSRRPSDETSQLKPG
jgi:CDP-glycerol glycerophosphotransferase